MAQSFDHSTGRCKPLVRHHGYSVFGAGFAGPRTLVGCGASDHRRHADWTAALLDAPARPKAKLIGHSMGSLIALETSARIRTGVGPRPDRNRRDDDRRAGSAQGRQANDPDAFDMVSIWGLGFKAELAAASRRDCG